MTDPTLRDIYEALGEIKSDVKTVITRGNDQEERIRSLETHRNMARGVLSIGTVAGAIAAIKAFANGGQ